MLFIALKLLSYSEDKLMTIVLISANYGSNETTNDRFFESKGLNSR